MKKILSFCLFFLLLLLTHNVGANWYGLTAVNYGGGTTTSCPSDGDTTGGTPTGYPNDTAVSTSASLSPNPVYNTYSLNSNQTNATNVSPTGTMYCMKWDGSNPTGSIAYFNGWTNNTTQTVSINLSDAGGSKLSSYTLQVRKATDTPNFTSWSSWTNAKGVSSINSNSYTDSYTYTAINGTAYEFQILVTDVAGNTYTVRSSNITKIDTTPPTAADISTTVSSDLLADSAYYYNGFNVNPGSGSPIVSIQGKKENYTTQAITDPFSTFSFIWDIRNVDLNRQSNGARLYSLDVNQVCDAAGNCWNGTKTFDHNVYANSTLMTGGSSSKSYTEALSNSTNVADGTKKDLAITLADTYGNKIVPASGIGRTIDFNFFYDNDLYLNQFTRTGNSAVYTDRCGPTSGLNHFAAALNTSKSCDNNAGSNGTYTYGFKIYTPTDNVYNKAKGKFTINNVTFDINGSIGQVLNQSLNSWSSIVAKYNPLYKTTLGGPQLSGFIEGVTQSGSLSISTNNPNGVSPSNRGTFLVFGGNTSDYDMNYSKTSNPSILVSENQSTLSTNYGIISGGLVTKLIQTSSTAPTSSNIYLSSHIQYDLDGLTPIYNSDIIGKNNYWDSLYIAYQQANQSQLKVYGTVGTTSSTKLNSFTSNQGGNAMEVNGGFDKALFRENLLAGVTRVVNSYVGNTQTNNSALPSLTSSTITTTSDSKIVGDKKNIILYKGNKLVSLDNGSDYNNTSFGISGKKTIVIYGGDLYINANMYYTDTSSVLGIIVMKDSAGNGGNIYINPKVTNVVGTIYASRSLFSASISSPNSYNDYTDMTYYDGNSDADILKNQLYIYGSLFSANTLGGSKSTPKKCPYYVPSGSCDADTAIKYDLNFLRRYYLVDNTTYKVPYSNGKIIGGETCTSGGCTSSSTLPQLFTAINYSNPGDAAYPLIIKYNPNLQTNPPPLFSSN